MQFGFHSISRWLPRCGARLVVACLLLAQPPAICAMVATADHSVAGLASISTAGAAAPQPVSR